MSPSVVKRVEEAGAAAGVKVTVSASPAQPGPAAGHEPVTDRSRAGRNPVTSSRSYSRQDRPLTKRPTGPQPSVVSDGRAWEADDSHGPSGGPDSLGDSESSLDRKVARGSSCKHRQRRRALVIDSDHESAAMAEGDDGVAAGGGTHDADDLPVDDLVGLDTVESEEGHADGLMCRERPPADFDDDASIPDSVDGDLDAADSGLGGAGDEVVAVVVGGGGGDGDVVVMVRERGEADHAAVVIVREEGRDVREAEGDRPIEPAASGKDADQRMEERRGVSREHSDHSDSGEEEDDDDEESEEDDEEDSEDGQEEEESEVDDEGEYAEIEADGDDKPPLGRPGPSGAECPVVDPDKEWLQLTPSQRKFVLDTAQRAQRPGDPEPSEGVKTAHCLDVSRPRGEPYRPDLATSPCFFRMVLRALLNNPFYRRLDCQASAPPPPPARTPRVCAKITHTPKHAPAFSRTHARAREQMCGATVHRSNRSRSRAPTNT